MDNAMLRQLMQSYGAADTPDNANRIREFFASNPSLAEHRAMGMRGSINDDNSDVLGPMLDKLIAQTSSPQQQVSVAATPPPASATSPARPQKQAAVPASRGIAPNTEPPSGSLGVNPVNPLDDAPNRQGSRVQALDVMPPQGEAAMAQGGDANWLLPFIASVFGARAAAPTTAPQLALPAPNAQLAAPQKALPAPQARITDQTPRGNFEDVGQQMQTVTNRNASAKTGRENQMRAEVDAENAQAARLMEQMKRQTAAQGETQALTKAAGRAVGRR